MICPIFAQNMCHKFPISVDGQNMGKICPKYGPQIGPKMGKICPTKIMGKIWSINWSYFAQNMAHKMGNVFEYLQCRYLCRKMETVCGENRLQRK